MPTLGPLPSRSDLSLKPVGHGGLRIDAFAIVGTPTQRAPQRRQATQQRVRPAVQRILDTMPVTPAFVLSTRSDILPTHHGAEARGGTGAAAGELPGGSPFVALWESRVPKVASQTSARNFSSGRM